MPTTPVSFKRGSTFSFMMKIPDTFADGFFRAYLPTAQLRRARNDQPNGLIADISCYWADPNTTRMLCFHNNSTDGWPLGLCELDAKFTAAAGGSKIRTNTVLFNIVRGITK